MVSAHKQQCVIVGCLVSVARAREIRMSIYRVSGVLPVCRVSGVRKVVRCALENAASVATLVLTSDALIAERPNEQRKDQGHEGDVY